MATRISTINAQVKATDAGFSATMGRVRSEASRTRDTLKGMSGGVGGSGGLLGGLFGGEGMAGIAGAAKAIAPWAAALGTLKLAAGEIKHSLKEIADGRDRIENAADTAEVLGLSYAELQAFNVAATFANTTLDKVEGAVGKFIKVITEAAEGSDEAENALRKLGLSINDFRGKSTFEAVSLVSDALGQMTSVGDRNTASMKLFGKEMGLKMVTALEGGSEALRRHTDKAQELELALSKLDVRTVKHYNTLKDLQKLREQGRKDSEAAKNDLANEMDVAMGDVGGFWSAFRTEWGGFATGLGGLVSRLNKVGGDFELLDQYNEGLAKIQALREETDIALRRRAGSEGIIDKSLLEADKKKIEAHQETMRQWKEEHDQWLQDFYSQSIDNVPNANMPQFFGMSLKDMAKAYEMQQRMAELDKIIREGEERDLIEADVKRRQLKEAQDQRNAEAMHRQAPLLIMESAEAQRSAYMAQRESVGVTADPVATSQAARDKERLRIERENARLLKSIENNTRPRSVGGVGV